MNSAISRLNIILSRLLVKRDSIVKINRLVSALRREGKLSYDDQQTIRQIMNKAHASYQDEIKQNRLEINELYKQRDL